MTAAALPGRRLPLGATVRDGGTNFAVAAATALQAGDQLTVQPRSIVVLRSPLPATRAS